MFQVSSGPGRPIATVVVAVLLVTAGCGGLAPDDSEWGVASDRGTYDVPERTADALQQTPTRAGPEFRRTTENHSVVVSSAEQFLFTDFRHVYRGESGADRPPVARTVAADLGADRYWITDGIEPDEDVYDRGRRYQSGSTVYRRIQGTNGTLSYRRVNDTGTAPRDVAVWAVRSLPDQVARYGLERNGTVTVRGTDLAKFTASEVPPELGCLPNDQPSPALRTVRTTRVVALVDGQGVIRRFECVYSGVLHTGDRYTERVIWTINRIGTTTVRPPAEGANVSSNEYRNGGDRTADIRTAVTTGAVSSDRNAGVHHGPGPRSDTTPSPTSMREIDLLHVNSEAQSASGSRAKPGSAEESRHDNPPALP